jgi:general secretion pathway protein K
MNGSILGQEKGMVLLLVLVVVALLAALLSEFAFSSLIDLRLAETYRDSTRAYYLARGGVRAAQMILKEDGTVYDARSEMWGSGVANLPIGGGIISITIEDLDGLLAINSLVVANNPQTEQKNRFLRLFENLGLEEPQNLAAALIDWLDSDDEVYNVDGAVGSESSYYLGLDPPYQARNGTMASIEELSLVKGFTPKVIEQIKAFMTLYGTMQVNCNTAPPEVIATLYLDKDQPVFLDDALDIAAVRDLTPFAGTNDFKMAFPELSILFPTSDELDYRLKYTSDYYRIRSQAWINDGTRTVTAVVRKSNNSILQLRVD